MIKIAGASKEVKGAELQIIDSIVKVLKLFKSCLEIDILFFLFTG